MGPGRLILAVTVVLAAAVSVGASGPLGIYGIVERVVLEPNDQAPERVQLWGAFAYVDGGAGRSLKISSVKRGYLYFRLGGAAEGVITNHSRLIRNEWADLKAVAGTGQAVGFGRWSYFGSFAALQPEVATPRQGYIFERSGPSSARTGDFRVRPATETPTAPALYETNSGLVKLSASGSHAGIVQQLRDALR